MKKTNLLLLSALFLSSLASCGVSGDNGSQTTSSEEQNTSFGVDRFTKTWSATFSATSKQGNNAEMSFSGVMDFGEGFISTKTNLPALSLVYCDFVEKNASGGVSTKSLNAKNEIEESVQPGLSYDEKYMNPFVDLVPEGEEVTEINLASENKMTEKGVKFGSLIGLSNSGTYTSFEMKIVDLDKKAPTLKVTASMSDGAGSIGTITYSIVFSEYANHLGKLAPLKETDDSKKIDTLIGKMQANNYTIEIKNADKVEVTYFVNQDRIYKQIAGQKSFGFLKTSSGYQALDVSVDGVVTESSTSTDPFSSLLADYDFSGTIFNKKEDGSYVLNDYLPSHNALNANFELAGALNSYMTNQSSDFTFLIDESSFAVKNNLGDDKDYTLTWKNFGNTTLPVDLTKITVVKSWTSEAPDVWNKMTTVLGKDFSFPYLDPGEKKTWAVDTNAGDNYCSVYVGGLTTQSIPAQISAYEKVLLDAGFTKLTNSQIANIASEDSWYFQNTSDNKVVFTAKEGFTVELYSSEDVDPYLPASFTGVGLWFSRLPDGVTL